MADSSVVNFDPDEVGIALENGRWIVTQSAAANPFGVDHVRIVDAEGNEVGYWISDEWRDAPESVMGAIIGAMFDDD